MPVIAKMIDINTSGLLKFINAVGYDLAAIDNNPFARITKQ